MNVKNLVTRIIAGVIYIAIVLFAIIRGREVFLLIFGAFVGIALYEFYRMVEKNTTHAIGKIFNITSGVLIFVSCFLYLEQICTYALPFFVVAYLLTLFASAIFINRKDIFNAVIYSVFGQVYITLSLCLLMFISHQHKTIDIQYHYVFVLAIFVLIWVNDTTAYFFGSLLGKRKLIERISPNKSIEGFISGIIFCIITAIIIAQLYTSYSIWFWVGFGIIVALFSTLGDLFESLIKRIYAVKDAGNLIPGHGGILDRIDSLLLVVPAIFLYLSLAFSV